jgi:hypothetical protein
MRARNASIPAIPVILSEKLAWRDFMAHACCRQPGLRSPARPYEGGSICRKSAVGDIS